MPDAQTIPLSFPSRGVAHKQERPGAGLGGGAYRGVARWDWLRGGGLAEGGTCEPARGCSSGQRGVGARVLGSRGPGVPEPHVLLRGMEVEISLHRPIHGRSK